MRAALVAVLALLALAACSSAPKIAVAPGRPLIIERVVYVPIDAALVDQHPIAEGPLSECPRVAAQRRAELEACNADKRATAAVQGSERK